MRLIAHVPTYLCDVPNSGDGNGQNILLNVVLANVVLANVGTSVVNASVVNA